MRSYKLQVMLSPEEKEMVDKLAESMAISNSAAVRYLIRSAASSAWGGYYDTPPCGHWSLVRYGGSGQNPGGKKTGSAIKNAGLRQQDQRKGSQSNYTS